MVMFRTSWPRFLRPSCSGPHCLRHVAVPVCCLQVYVEALDRIVLKEQRSVRSFTNVTQVRKTAVTTRVMQLVHEVLSKGIHVTKRDMFYTDVKLFQKQDESDAVLDDVACMMSVCASLVFSSSLQTTLAP